MKLRETKTSEWPPRRLKRDPDPDRPGGLLLATGSLCVGLLLGGCSGQQEPQPPDITDENPVRPETLSGPLPSDTYLTNDTK